MTGRKIGMLARVTLTIALLVLVVAPACLPLYAHEAEAIVLDKGGFGMAQVDDLEPKAAMELMVDLKAGDRVAMDLQGESDALAVSAFEAPWGALVMEGVPEAFNYLAWAPEDGTYTIVVENMGAAAAGFVLRVAVSPAPLPTAKILTVDADGQTIPVVVDEPFQVQLNTDAGGGFTWTLAAYDDAVLAEVGEPAMVLLGTMPGAMSAQIFTFNGMAPGVAQLNFANGREGDAEPAATYSVNIEVVDAGELAAEPLTLDANGTAQAQGTLAPQGMAGYVIELEEGAAVQAAITPGDTGFVLTVVGADGMPLQTDHAGASDFAQTMPVTQEYTFKVINFGDIEQEYTFDLTVGPAAPAPTAEDDTALGTELATRFLDAIQAGDRDAVGDMLAPAFQLMRANGESFDADTYLDNLPDYEAYTLSDVRVTHDGDVLVVAYKVAIDTTMDGGAADFGAPAPRLSTFQQIDGAWKLLSHANFSATEAVASSAAGSRAVVTTDAAPAPIGPYSQAIRAGELLFTSGQVGLDPVTGVLAEGVEAQTHQALANVEAILAAAGASPADVVKTTIYLADIADFETVNAIYGAVFQDAPPARSTVQVAALPRGARVEIEVVALVPQQ
jgi:2-iminobutanoate/2-iminopropanoate deaminase